MTAPGAPQAAAIGGPFRLTDQDGRVVTQEDLKGRPSLVFFGFTHCPDVCPTTLFDISQIMAVLGPDADRTRAVFITVDPERDTQSVLKDYLSSFDPHLTGLTGDLPAITTVAKEYRAYFKKVPLDGGGYTMDHTAITYLMDKEGRFVSPFNLKRTPEAAAADLRRQL
jgi:protein SCO1